jgi:hypothetical protein
MIKLTTILFENIIVSENEQTIGLDNFISEIIKEHPETEKYSNVIKQSIINSGCKRIEFAKFKYPASGLALSSGVLINKNKLYGPLDVLLYTIFHEIAHSYQYKKYGEKKMYEFYNDEVSLDEAAKLMRNIELVADEFSLRKCREFVKLGLIDEFNVNSYYKNVSLQQFKHFINSIKENLKISNLKSPEEINKYFYNLIKSIPDEYNNLNEENLNEDRCKRIADRKYDKPSAYKSGAIVRCRKGNIWKGLKEDESLHKWFKRQGPSGKEGGWVDCNTCRRDKSGKKKCKSCGRKEGESRSKYPSCRPTPSQCSQPGKGKKWGKTK